MKTRKRTSEEAIAELIELHDRFKDREEGERLTHTIIQKGVGISQAPTISRWMNRHNKPTGLGLSSLSTFLDNAKKKGWLEKFIAENNPKGNG